MIYVPEDENLHNDRRVDLKSFNFRNKLVEWNQEYQNSL
jgi:hypothetical protein